MLWLATQAVATRTDTRRRERSVGKVPFRRSGAGRQVGMTVMQMTMESPRGFVR